MNVKEELSSFKLWMERLGYAESTIESYTRLLQNFFDYLNGSKPTQTKIEAFSIYLHQQPICRAYITHHINVINRYSEFLELTTKQKLTVGKINIEKDIPTERMIFSQDEITALFKATDGDGPNDLFDRTMLNLYYGCGLRCSEGTQLKPAEIDFNKGLLYIKPGKNYTSRYVPLSEKVKHDLQEYLTYAREFINPNSPYLLPAQRKEQSYPVILNKRFRRLQQKAGITKQGSLHSLRHSIATHLLQKGMDIEHIGEFLGHKSLDSTQRYVRMNHELLQGAPAMN